MPTSYAAMMHPLHVKTAFYVRLPWHWLGGTLHELWKKIGSKALIANYREIMLVEHEGNPSYTSSGIPSSRPLPRFLRRVSAALVYMEVRLTFAT